MNQELQVVTNITDINTVVFNNNTMNQLEKIADMMASSKISIPQHLRGNKADCFAIALQSSMWHMNPFAVAQKTHMTQGGALGYEAQLISAVITANAPVTGAPEYEYIGDWNKVLGKVEERKSEKNGGKYYVATYTKADEQGLGIICRMTLKGESKPREITVMMSQCYPRFSTQWATDPKMQISFVSIRKWSRMHSPGVILGVYTDDELTQEVVIEKEINPVVTETVESFSSMLARVGTMTMDELSTIDTNKLSEDEKKALRPVYSKRKKELSVVADIKPVSIADQIESCTTQAEVDAVEQRLSPDEWEDFRTVLDDKRDSLRV